MDKYYPRVADKLISDSLRRYGAVLIEGPRGCGKTTTAENLAKSVMYVGPESVERYNDMLAIDPDSFFAGENPRLIDEWQLVPLIWDMVRRQVDKRKAKGQFILTGSSVPVDASQISHSGTLRIDRVRMGTMSLYESGDSQGTVSIKELFDSPSEIHGVKQIDSHRLAYLICRGGWPSMFGMDDSDALELPRGYYRSLISEDLTRVDGIKRNSSILDKILRSYSKNLCTQTKYTKISDDVRLSESSTVSNDTVYSYLDAMKKLFVISETPAWQPNILSNIYVRSTETRNFTDPSIAVAALKLTPDILLQNPTMFGKLFESLCLRDLGAYAQYLGGNLYRYRDSSNLECDAVIQLEDGGWGAVEFKLSKNHTDEGAENLKKLRKKIDESHMKPPSFLMILSGTEEWAYRRKDGVYVVPIDCIKF
ncbi:MAG: DUF4143 domain-containing protein [Clostridia bacterium]|nr:DUF4143 domain-containing protein [Clostridia bacterium]